MKTSITAKYTFTISTDGKKRYINVEYPPIVTLLDVDSIYSFWLDLFHDMKEQQLKEHEALKAKSLQSKKEKWKTNN